MGTLGLSCGEATSGRELDGQRQRAAEQALDRLQRSSPLQRAVKSAPAAPPGSAAEVESRAAELVAEPSSADAGVALPEPGEPAPPPHADSPDAGATVTEPTPEVVPPESAPDAGAAPADPAPVDPTPPTDIVAEAALPVFGLVAGELLSEAQLWERLQQAPVTCFGELHNRPGDHFAQTRALSEELARATGAPLALGMEMFQRPFQAPLSAYVQGELDEAGLLAATEYAERWGYDFAFYRPLLEAARSAGLPALALNAPRELTRKIGRTGLESLDDGERAQLPELVLDDAEHREFIFSLLGAVDHDLQLALENVYVAQTVWDETMAASSASWLESAGPGARLLILAGSAHCHESAIPRRLTRRSGVEVTSLAVALASELATPDFSASGYDVLVVLEDVPLPAELPPAQ